MHTKLAFLVYWGMFIIIENVKNIHIQTFTKVDKEYAKPYFINFLVKGLRKSLRMADRYKGKIRHEFEMQVNIW